METGSQVISNTALTRSLALLGDLEGRLAQSFQFDWPFAVRQSVRRLRLPIGVPACIAVVGGASSGKSTIFNNLLGGRRTSRVTARGHATLGPVLAVHEHHRDLLERLEEEQLFFPDLKHKRIDLDDDVTGDPGALAVVFHNRQPLRDVWILDTPDFTSQLAELEGDVTLGFLPWFDRLVVVVDFERWFDRQSVSQLRAESVRYGQERFIVFNRTQDATLSDRELDRLRQQAERLDAAGTQVLEHRRGRGLCAFPPDVFDELINWMNRPAPDRTQALLRRVCDSAGRVLNQNQERAARLEELRRGLRAVEERCLPPVRDWITALMTSAERRQLEPLARVLGLGGARSWFSAGTRRLQEWINSVPLLGGATRWPDGQPGASSEGEIRRANGRAFFNSSAARMAREMHRVVQGSTFWTEISRWTQRRPKIVEYLENDALSVALEENLFRFERALVAWNARVENECQGIAPHVKGAAGAGLIALFVVLIAAPGPLGALTLVLAKGAVAGAFAHVVAATGAGALLGKYAGRLVEVVREKLLGSIEWDALQTAAVTLRDQSASVGRSLADAALNEATGLVLFEGDPLHEALRHMTARREAMQ